MFKWNHLFENLIKQNPFRCAVNHLGNTRTHKYTSKESINKQSTKSFSVKMSRIGVEQLDSRRVDRI